MKCVQCAFVNEKWQLGFTHAENYILQAIYRFLNTSSSCQSKPNLKTQCNEICFSFKIKSPLITLKYINKRSLNFAIRNFDKTMPVVGLDTKIYC